MKTWNQVSAGDINAANQRLWLAVGDSAEAVVVRINTDPVFLEKIAQFMRCCCEPAISQKLAREIMGKNFFGIEEAVKYFEVNTSKQSTTYLNDIPFSEEMLRSCKDTHILLAVFQLSIIDIRTIVEKQSDSSLFSHQDWYNNMMFAKDKGRIGWWLVRKEPVEDSASKAWDEQHATLLKDEEVPTARVVVYAMVGHFLATKERLFCDVHVRTASLGADSYRVRVSGFDYKGLDLAYFWDHIQDEHLGLAAIKRSLGANH